MARYSGMIGYALSVPHPEHPSIWQDKIVEHRRYGDLIKESSKWQPNQTINEDLELTNRISIVADKFSMDNMANMKYATLHGSKWSIKSATIQYPRIILYLGGLYNGPEPEEI